MAGGDNTRVFRLTYVLEPLDLAAMIRDRETHRFLRIKQVFYYGIFAVMLWAIAFGFYLLASGTEDALGLIMIGIIGLVGVPLLRWGQPLLTAGINHRRLNLKNTMIDTEFSIDGISSKSKGVSSSFEWQMVEKLTRSKDHYFFWINKLQAIIIPLRCLPDRQEQAALWRLAEDMLLQNRAERQNL